MFCRLKIGLIEEETQDIFLLKVEMKDYNVMMDGRNVFDQPIKNDKITYDNNRKIATGQEDDCTTGCLLDYLYFKENYKLIAIDLSKQKQLDSDSKEIQKIDFADNLENSAEWKKQQKNKRKSKKNKKNKQTNKTVIDFPKGTVLWFYFVSI